LVRNEQAKLTATYLNGIAIAVAAVGGIAPWIPHLAQESTSGARRLAVIAVGCVLLSVGLHFLARTILTKLTE
jgi:sulfite exporter TauE/SafE